MALCRHMISERSENEKGGRAGSPLCTVVVVSRCGKLEIVPAAMKTGAAEARGTKVKYEGKTSRVQF